MRIKGCKKLLVFFIWTLLLTYGTPAWAAEESSTSNNIISDVVGASAGNGNYNTAIGVAGVIGDGIVIGDLIPIDEYNNGQAGYQALAGNGQGNRAIGSGAIASGNYNTAIGSGSRAFGDNNTALGSGAVAVGGGRIGSVALGANSIATEPDTVSIGQPGYERRITNVAPGVYDTDAVNMSQLRGLDNKVNRVGSMALAFSALAPLQYDPKEPTQYSAGMGTYNGTGAIAVGVFHYANSNVMLNAAIGMSNDGWEKSARFGISWRTGGPKKKELTPAIATPPSMTVVDRVKMILEDSETQGS